MAVYSLPLDQQLPWYSFRTVLSGITYQLEARYNGRAGHWLLQLQNTAGQVLAAGIPLLPRLDLLAPHRAQPVPPGDLVVQRLQGSADVPGLQGFVSDFALLYVDDT